MYFLDVDSVPGGGPETRGTIFEKMRNTRGVSVVSGPGPAHEDNWCKM